MGSTQTKERTHLLDHSLSSWERNILKCVYKEVKRGNKRALYPFSPMYLSNLVDGDLKRLQERLGDKGYTLELVIGTTGRHPILVIKW